MPTLSPAPSLTPSPVSITRDNSNHRPFAGGLLSPTKRSTDFVALLDRLGATYGTTERTRPLVAVLDNGPIHRSKLTTRALAQRPWLTLEWLPKYAPELNDPGSRPGQAIER